MTCNKFFNAETPAQFKGYGVEIEYNHFSYESATGPDNVVIRADGVSGGWIELELSIENKRVWRCDGETIKEEMFDHIK